MLKALLAAILVALVVVILLLLSIARPDRGPAGSVAVNSASAPPPSSFVVRNNAPPAPPVDAPAPPPAAPAPDSLDVVMQRLRSAKPDATVVVTPAAPAPVPPPVPPPPVSPPVLPVVPAPLPEAPAPVPAPPRWTNVSGQGVQYRVGRAGDGYVISIDLGGGQVADVHVLPAFGRLDQAAVNMRVDYLKQTILENFSSASASYSYNRDGSVSGGR